MSEAQFEKLEKGLRCHSDVFIEEPDCEHCEYDNASCGYEIPSDALALIRKQQERIKELETRQKQEPALLENQHKPYGHFINANSPWISRCPKCGRKVEGKQIRYCKYCGQAVKWE